MSVALETLIQTNSAQKRSKKELVKKYCIIELFIFMRC
jgi:hypothetical protein